jgi:hypothetical protein
VALGASGGGALARGAGAEGGRALDRERGVAAGEEEAGSSDALVRACQCGVGGVVSGCGGHWLGQLAWPGRWEVSFSFTIVKTFLFSKKGREN